MVLIVVLIMVSGIVCILREIRHYWCLLMHLLYLLMLGIGHLAIARLKMMGLLIQIVMVSTRRMVARIIQQSHCVACCCNQWSAMGSSNIWLEWGLLMKQGFSSIAHFRVLLLWITCCLGRLCFLRELLRLWGRGVRMSGKVLQDRLQNIVASGARRWFRLTFHKFVSEMNEFDTK